MSRGALAQAGVEFIVIGNKNAQTAIEQFNKAIHSLIGTTHEAEKSGSGLLKIGAGIATGAAVAVAAVTALTGATLAATGAAVKFAADYQSAMTVVAAVSEATSAQIGALDKEIQSISRTSVVGLTAAAGAAGELARAGVSIDTQLSGALKAVTNLSVASAGELGLDKSARLVATALNTWQLPGERAAEVVDAITVAAQKSSISYNDLMRSFMQVAPVAASLGITVQDTAAAVGMLGLAGLRGSDAGTSLKQAFIQLMKPSKMAREEMEKYGISLFDTTGASRPLRDILAGITENLGDAAVESGKLTQQQQFQALATIFGADAIRTATSVNNLGIESFDKLRAAMDSGTLSAAHLAAIMQEPLAARIQILMNNFTAFATILGSAFVPIISDVVNGLLTMAQNFDPTPLLLFGQTIQALATGQGFGQLFTAIQSAVGGTQDFVTGIDEAGNEIVTTQANITTLGTFLVELVNLFRNIGVAAGIVGTAVKTVADNLAGVPAAGTPISGTINIFKSLSEAVINTAVGIGKAIIVIGAIVGVMASIAGSIARVISAFFNLVGSIVHFVTTNEAAKTVILGIALAIGTALTVMAAQAVAAFIGMAIAVAPFAIAFAAAVISVIAAKLLIIAAVVAVAIAVAAAVRWMVENWDSITAVVGGMVNGVVEYLGHLASFMEVWIHIVGSILDGLINMFGGVPGAVFNALKGIVPVVANVLNAIGQAIAQFATNIANIPVIGEAMGFVASAFSAVGAAAASMGEGIGAGVESVKGLAGNIPTALTSMDKLGGSLRTMALGGRDAAEGIDGVNNAANRGAGTLPGFGDAADGAGKKAKGAADKLEKEVIPAIDGFIKKWAELMRLRDFTDAFGELGAAAIDTLVQSITENTDESAIKAAEALKKLVDEVRRNDIPEWADLGNAAVEAYETALVDRTEEATQAAVDAVAAMADAIKQSGALTLENFANSFEKAGTKERLGSAGASFMDSLRTAIIDGGKKSIDQMAESANEIVKEFIEKMPPDKAKAATAEFMKAVTRAITEQTPESTKAVSDLVQKMRFDAQMDIILDKVKKVTKDRLKEVSDVIKDSPTVEAATAMIQGLGDAFNNEEIAAMIEGAKVVQAVKAARTAIEEDIEGILDAAKRTNEIEIEGLKARGNKEELTLQRQLSNAERNRQNAQEVQNARNRGASQEEINRILQQNAVEAQSAAIKQRNEDKLNALKATNDAAVEALKRQRDAEYEQLKKDQAARLAKFDADQQIILQTKKITDIMDASNLQLQEIGKERTALEFIRDNVTNVLFNKALTESQAINQAIIDTTQPMQDLADDANGFADAMARAASQFDTGKIPSAVGGNIVAQGFQRGGMVPGPFGSKQLVMAHGGETISPLAAVGARETYAGPQHNNNYSYSVNASYAHTQSEASVIQDLRALVAMSAK